MDLEFENPFAGYGTIVHGQRFIGRKDALQVVESRVIRPREPGNLAIIGDYRIGKSSLVYQALIEPKSKLTARHLLPIWVNFGIYDSRYNFFRSLVTHCYHEIEDLDWLTVPLKDAATNAKEDGLSWTESYARIQRFFQKVRQAEVRIVLILDEFDHARHLFQGDVSAFQCLRDLSYQPELRVTLVTISRRSLHDIEQQTKATSTFDLIFEKHYLAMFDEPDIDQYFSRLSSVGIRVTPELRAQVTDRCGGHPFLLDILGYEIVEMFRRRQEAVDVGEAALRGAGSFLDLYDRMASIVKEGGGLNKLLEILFGPGIDVNQADIDEFVRYGIIKQTDTGGYTAFSPHFLTYLRLWERQVDLWSIWRATEVGLRTCVTKVMLQQYGDKWLETLQKARPNLNKIFDQCTEAQEKEQKSFPNRASCNLLDFTYPQDLFAIIFAEWSVFKNIFGKDPGYWDHRARLLAKMRTPLAHNRGQALHDHERRIAEGYCEEILAALQSQPAP